MRVPDNLLHSVGFLARASEPDKFLGTAFIAHVESKAHPGVPRAHLVTAKHVAVQLQSEDSHFIITEEGGERVSFIVPVDTWRYHPTESDSVDVATAFLFPLSDRPFRMNGVPETIFATKEKIVKYKIGLGNETIAVGLFSFFQGRTRLTPLVRTGTVAMMPVDKVPTSHFGDIEAYLVEGFAMQHQSGSPIFVRSSLMAAVSTKDGKQHQLEGGGPLHLLGLLHGHYEGISSDGSKSSLNMNVVIVIPANKILETLNHPDLVMFRSMMDDPALWDHPNQAST